MAVLSPTLNMNDFRHSPYWKHRFVMRVQFFKGSIFNHVFTIVSVNHRMIYFVQCICLQAM